MLSEVILVDEYDHPTGTMEKLEAHRQGLLHRAFSVFIINDKGELLLQRRADEKYHSAGLWTNTCCSHPAPGEHTIEAAKRRLQEEMGFSCAIEKIDEFKYRAEFSNGLTEHEYDHIFIGVYNGQVFPNKEEVSEYKWLSVAEIDEKLKKSKSDFTYWFHIAFPLFKKRTEKF